MADQELDDGEFWLPPQFLTDDDILMDFHKTSNTNSRDTNNTTNKLYLTREAETTPVYGYDYHHHHPTYNGFGSSAGGPYSDLSSPVESVMGSTETESDEDDYISGLTHKMPHSTTLLHHHHPDDLWKIDSRSLYENNPKVMASSPQSTLLGGCGCKQGSSRGSPNCPSSQLSSPPATAEMSRSEAAWDLLYAAAGEVARMRMIEESTGYYQNRGLLGHPRKPTPVSSSIPPLKTTSNSPTNVVGFLSNHHPPSYQQLQVSQFQQLKQQQMLKNQIMNGQYQQQEQQTHHHHHHQQMVQAQNKAAARTNPSGRPLNLPVSAWPTLQQSQTQPPGSGMRAVFLGNHHQGSKKECAGTGVFLPRRVGSSPTETRKKPACSTVLLPDRVVQALNLKLDSMDVAPPQLLPRHTGNFSPDYDTAMKYRNNAIAMAVQQRPSLRPQTVMNNDFRLPQEWTY